MKSNLSIFLSLIAVLMQYYCYAIFGFSSIVLAEKFLPAEQSDITKYIQFFSIFTLAMIARPFGATILSKIGDRYGKTHSLLLSGAAASLANFAIAFIPAYTQIGLKAVIGLILCRMLMLVSISGELDGVRLYLTEKFPKYQYFVSALISASTQLGVLIAALFVYLASTLNNFWHWKFNFIIGGIFGVLVCLIRMNFDESDKFITYKKSGQYSAISNMPIISIFTKYRLLIILLIVINGIIGAGYHIHIIFLSVYLKDILHIQFHYDIFWYNIISVMIYLISSIFWGILAEKYQNIKNQILFSIAASIFIAALNGFLLQNNSTIFVATNLIAIFLMPAFALTIPIYIQQTIAYGLRYRVLSISHAIGSVVISASSPLICTFIYKNILAISSPYIYFSILLCILLFAFICLEKYKSYNSSNF